MSNLEDQTTLSNAFLLTVSLVAKGSVKPLPTVTWEMLFASLFWLDVRVPTVAGVSILASYYALISLKEKSSTHSMQASTKRSSKKFKDQVKFFR